jgi:hypothetical protein
MWSVLDRGALDHPEAKTELASSPSALSYLANGTIVEECV